MSARDDVESAYEIASSIDLALLNISSDSEGNRWPDSLYFASLAENLERADVVRAASQWMPPQLMQVCGANEATMHEALLALAHAAFTTDLVARSRPSSAMQLGFPPAKEWFAIFADYPAGTVSGLLKVEHRQAMNAVKAAETTIQRQPAKASPLRRDNLKPKHRKALELIENLPEPTKGRTIATRLGIRLTTFQKHYVQALKPFGLRNDGDGYFVDLTSS